MALMLLPSLVGMFLFGAVRMWSVGPLMFLSGLGLFLASLRPFFNGNLLRFQLPPGALLWALFGLYALARIPFSASPYDARLELLKFASWWMSYVAWTELAQFHKRWKVLLGLALFVVTLMAWYALIQHAQGSRMVLNLERPEVYGMRASGAYFCPNHFAALIVIVLPFCLSLLFAGGAGFPLRLLAGYSLLLFLPVVYLTQSRSGWIGTVVGLGGCALLLALRRSRKAFLLLLVLIPLLLGGVAWGLWTFSPMVRTRVTGAMLKNPDGAVLARLYIWKDSVPMVRERPVWGWGGNSFHWIYPRYKSNTLQFFFNYAHNEALELLIEYGAVGLVLFAVFLLYACYRFFRLMLRAEQERDAALIAGLLAAVSGSVAHAMFDFNLHIFSNMHLLMLLAGVTAAGLFSSGLLRARELSAGWGRVQKWGGVLATALLPVLALQALASYGLHFVGEEKRIALQMDEAVRLFQIATRVDPGNWRPWLGLAHVDQTRGFWDMDPDYKARYARQAVEHYEEAHRRNPCDMEVVYGLGKAWDSLGDREKALEFYREAAAKEKFHLFYTTRLGLHLRKMGRYQESLDTFLLASTYGAANDMISLNVPALQQLIAAQKAEGENPP